MTCKDCRLHKNVCDGYMPTDMDSDEVLEYCASGRRDKIPFCQKVKKGKCVMQWDLSFEKR